MWDRAGPPVCIPEEHPGRRASSPVLWDERRGLPRMPGFGEPFAGGQRGQGSSGSKGRKGRAEQLPLESPWPGCHVGLRSTTLGRGVGGQASDVDRLWATPGELQAGGERAGAGGGGRSQVVALGRATLSPGRRIPAGQLAVGLRPHPPPTSSPCPGVTLER